MVRCRYVGMWVVKQAVVEVVLSKEVPCVSGDSEADSGKCTSLT